MSESHAVSSEEIVRRCLAHECPDCGKALPKGRPWNFPFACKACGFVLRRHEGFFLGALVLNYAMTAFGALPLTVLAWKLGWVPPKVALALALTLGFSLPVLLYRFSWRLWLAGHYGFLPEQLPVNGAKADDTDD